MSTSWQDKLARTNNICYDLQEERKMLHGELEIMFNLVESVTYSAEEAEAFLKVGTEKVNRIADIDKDMFVYTQLIEVYKTHQDVDEASLTMH